MGESDVQNIIRKLDEHETIFRDISEKIGGMSEQLKNYPQIVEQTNKNSVAIDNQRKRCTEVQDKKKSKEEVISLIKVGVIVGVIVAIVTAALTIGLFYANIGREVTTYETEQIQE